MRGLTSLFGMGRGGHPLHSHQNSPFDHWRRHIRTIRKAFGQLVLLGFAIAGSTPAAYQGRRLRPPYDEVSSWGGLRTYMLSALIPSRHSYPAVPLALQPVH